MLHPIAFVLIGLCIGVAISYRLKKQLIATTVGLALVGSIVAGEVVEWGLGHGQGKYLSLVAAAVLAVVVGVWSRRRDV